MNQNFTSRWSQSVHFAFLTFSFYLVLFFLFISNFIGGAFYQYDYLKDINKPFRYINTSIVSVVNKLFIHKPFPGVVYGDDNYWNLIAQIFWLVIAMILALICNRYFNKKPLWKFYHYVQIFARYYLVSVLFLYGFDKVDYNQFKVGTSTLGMPVGDARPYWLFQAFMNTSKSYEFYAGFIEIVAAVLLLFRRTCIIGSLVASLVLLNVLMLNIAFDISLKLEIINLILFCTYIFLPYIKNIVTYLFSLQDKLVPAEHLEAKGRKKWLSPVLKYSFFAIVVFMLVRLEVRWYKENNSFSHKDLLGIHLITELKSTGNNADCERTWHKLTFNYDPSFGLHLMNDSIGGFVFTLDNDKHILEFNQATPEKIFGIDSMSRGRLNFRNIQNDQWRFEGIFNSDSVSFTTKKLDNYDVPLLKEYGKMTWFYWY